MYVFGPVDLEDSVPLGHDSFNLVAALFIDPHLAEILKIRIEILRRRMSRMFVLAPAVGLPYLDGRISGRLAVDTPDLTEQVNVLPFRDTVAVS